MACWFEKESGLCCSRGSIKPSTTIMVGPIVMRPLVAAPISSGNCRSIFADARSISAFIILAILSSSQESFYRSQKADRQWCRILHENSPFDRRSHPRTLQLLGDFVGEISEQWCVQLKIFRSPKGLAKGRV